MRARPSNSEPLALVASLALALGLAACDPGTRDPGASNPDAGDTAMSAASSANPQECALGRWPELVRLDVPELPTVLGAPPADVHRAIPDRHLLKPDRRFLLALVVADCLLTGEAPERVDVRWDGAAWLLEAGSGDAIGSLPHLPDFMDAKSVLAERMATRGDAVRLNAAPPLPEDEVRRIRALLNGFDAVGVADALQRIDDLWSETGPHAELLALAAEGLVLLTIQIDDRLDLTDPLAARALATLVAAQTLTEADLRREEALLAQELDYSVHAQRVAMTLPEGDDVRAHVLGGEEVTAPDSVRGGAEALVRHLQARRFSEPSILERLADWTRGEGPAPAISLANLRLALQEVDRLDEATGELLSRVVPAVALLELWETVEAVGGASRGSSRRSVGSLNPEDLQARVGGAVDDLGSEPASLTEAFEQGLDELRGELRGPFLDADTYGSYLAGHFYSGLYLDGRRLLRRGVQSPAAASFLARLDARRAGTRVAAGADLHRWFESLSAPETGRPRPERLLADVGGLEVLGPEALEDTFEELVRFVDWSDPRRQEAGLRLARRLDSRVDHAFVLGSLSLSHLYDLYGADHLYRRILEVNGPKQPRLRAWMAMYERDAEALRTFIADSTHDLGDRVYAFELAAGRGLLPPDELRGAAEALSALDRSEWDVPNALIEYYERRLDHESALAIATTWWRELPQQSGFPDIFARTAIARQHQRLGRLDEALRWIDPVVRSGQNGALGRAASIRAERAELDTALSLADAAVGRYPRSLWARTILAQVHWRAGRHDLAADVVHDARHPIDNVVWRGDVAMQFAAAFDGRPPAEADAALDALRRKGVPPWYLLDLALGLERLGRTDLAFSVAYKQWDGSIDALRALVEAHGYLSKLGGPASAEAWLRSVVPPNLTNPLGMFLYAQREDGLLWDVIPAPEAGPFPSQVWLLRAAAHVRGGGGDAENARTLRDHFAAEGGDDYHSMGRYLMGLEPEEAILGLALSPDRLCEVGYYVGLKATAEGRFRDAVDWFRVVLETGLTQEGEYAWSMQTLASWSGSQLVALEAR